MYLDGSRKQIIAWVAQGLNDREIAERVRVSPSTVRYWRERNGVTRPPKPAKAVKTPIKAAKTATTKAAQKTKKRQDTNE